MAAKKPDISLSCFLENECGITIGSASIKDGLLYSFHFLLRNSSTLISFFRSAIFKIIQ